MRRPDSPAATTLRTFAGTLLTPGSFVIERYVYERATGKTGVQWIVHRVQRDGEIAHLIALDSRRDAARFIEEHRG